MGCVLGESEVAVTTRELLAYAAGIGARAPRDLDDAAEVGLVAAPPYCVSLEWPILSGTRQRDALGVRPDEAIRGVHARQDLDLPPAHPLGRRPCDRRTADVGSGVSSGRDLGLEARDARSNDR